MERRSLPLDLAEEILSLVPAKSVARLRFTCKGWNRISKSGSFAKMHTAKAPKEQSLMITLIDSKVCLLRINLHAPSVKVTTHPFYLKDPLSDSWKEVDIRNVFQCDGLLLCTTSDKRLVVWNPCSGETTWIKPRDRYKKTDYYALGYDDSSSCKQYKILRVDRHQDLPVKNEYEIYDFASNSWRVLGVANDWFLALICRGVSVKGNTYWVAERVPARPYPSDIILTFNFTREMFHRLSLPFNIPFRDSISALSVDGEEQLCLLGIELDRPSDLQVWVKTSTGSWNNSSATRPKYEGDIYMFSKGIRFLAEEQNKVDVVYLNTNNVLHILRENKHIREKRSGVGKRKSTKHMPCKLSSVLLSYIPSLVQIQQGSLSGGRKRKAPST